MAKVIIFSMKQIYFSISEDNKTAIIDFKIFIN